MFQRKWTQWGQWVTTEIKTVVHWIIYIISIIITITTNFKFRDKAWENGKCHWAYRYYTGVGKSRFRVVSTWNRIYSYIITY